LLDELVPAAAAKGHEVLLVADELTLSDPLLPGPAEQRPVAVDVPPVEAAAAGGNRSMRDMVRMTRAFVRAKADVVFFPATYSYVPVPFTKVVVTAHDAIAEKRPDLIVPSRADRWRWAAKQRLALRQAKLVLTVSDAARDDLVRVLHVAPGRLRVVGEAADPRFTPTGPAGPSTHGSKPVVDQPYFLYVGGFSPHKNIVTLVRAFDDVADREPNVALVLVGDIQDDPFLSSISDVEQAIRESRHADRVHVTGFVADDDLVELYRRAHATVLVSFGEGFGLPVAESMACGTPVIVSNEPALRENAGDAACYVDPLDASQLAKAMAELLTDSALRDRLAVNGLQRASRHSWAASAATVLGVLEEVGA
jgi:glycosyltransferase involved in cell wall biosynthesis